MKFFFSFFLFAVNLFASLGAEESILPIGTRVKSIPCEERQLLSRFFKRLFYHGDFSYTLLDSKPMGSIDYNLNLLVSPQFYKDPEKHLFLMALDEKGWSIWEQYKALFPMKKYSFIKVNYGTFFGFLLINKEKSYAVIEENLTLFQELVGRKICVRKILRLLCDGKFGYYHSNSPCLFTYYEALGLLYGYGRDNVNSFIKRAQLSQKLRSLPLEIKTLPKEVVNCIEMEDTLTACSKYQHESALEIKLLAYELKTLLDRTQLIKGTKKYNPFFPMKRSLFLGNKECYQTQAIIKNHDKLNDTILKIHESDNFLETILDMLTS